MSVTDSLAARRSCRDFHTQPLTEADVKAVLWAAQGITGADGARTAPSAHALYPTRTLMVAGRIDGLAPGVYAPGDHDDASFVEQRAGDCRAALQAAALEAQPWIGNAPVIFVIAADFDAARAAFADQPPQGTRGERYVWIEAGTMAQNMHLAAIERGLGGVLVAGFDDDATAKALTLDAPWQPVLMFCAGHPLDPPACVDGC